MNRVPAAVDVQRVGQAVSFRGIDPRVWQSLAVVTAVQVGPSGVKVDVELHPSGVEETARVGAEFAGVGIGLYMPIAVDDEVIVGYPGGDRDAGLIVLKRLHSISDPLPSQAVAAPNDVWLVVGNNVNVNIITSGTGKVFLGDSVGASPVARIGDSAEVTGSNLTALQTLLDTRYAIGGGSPLNLPGNKVTSVITTGASKVEAK